MLENMLNSGGNDHHEIFLKNRFINCMLRDITFENKPMHMFLFIDITQVQEFEKQKLEAKFKNIFLSSMSHNLKTPLNSLIINNEIQESQIIDKNSLAYDIVLRDRQQLTLLNFLVCDILDFSKLYSEEFRPNCSYFRLESFL